MDKASPPKLNLLEELAQNHAGIYTDGRFVTLNAAIEEARAEILVAGSRVFIFHTVRQSVRPSMSASFWRIRSVVPSTQKIRLRLCRKTLGQHRWPWQQVFWVHAEEGIRWEFRGRRRVPNDLLLKQRVFQQALAQSAASSIFLKPHPTSGVVLEMHLKGQPRDYAVLEDQWQAYLRLMECIVLAE